MSKPIKVVVMVVVIVVVFVRKSQKLCPNKSRPKHFSNSDSKILGLKNVAQKSLGKTNIGSKKNRNKRHLSKKFRVKNGNKTWSSVSNSSLSKTFVLGSLESPKIRNSVLSHQRSYSFQSIFGQQ